MTPMMQQYYEVKARAGNAIVFFRMGDFYEIFDEDARLVAPLLDLTLTAREKGDATKVPFCGVPHHSAKQYWIRLLQRGFSVALCDQIEDPEFAKGLVERDIVRIYTPGTLDELEGLSPDTRSYLLSIFEEPTSRITTCILADVSTGLLSLHTPHSRDEIKSLIARHQPKEILCRSFFKSTVEKLFEEIFGSDSWPTVSLFSEESLREHPQLAKRVEEIFGSHKATAQNIQKNPSLKLNLQGLVCYLDSLKVKLGNFRSVSIPTLEKNLRIDGSAIRDLEVFETVRRRDRSGSLFSVVNLTVTPMGARKFRDNLLSPSRVKEQIESHHKFTKLMLTLSQSRPRELQTYLQGVSDVERLFNRLERRVSLPAELLKLRAGLSKVLDFQTKLVGQDQGSSIAEPIFSYLNLHQKYLAILNDAFVEESEFFENPQRMFRKSLSSELAKLYDLMDQSQDLIQRYEQRLKEQTGINSLKIKEHKSYGLLIEVTKTHLSKVPATFARKQTLVNAERFLTPELANLADDLSQASDRLASLNTELYESVMRDLTYNSSHWQSLCEAIALCDLHLCFARLIVENGYILGSVCEDNKIEIVGCRHPVVEKAIGKHAFCANSLQLPSRSTSVLITGPNMAGKSTYMRKMALSVLLHQAGSPIPCLEAALPIFDQIFTRIGASDDLARGQSTFFVEMSETAEILRSATENSLIILDEIGRGTSSEDGLALASAVLEDLCQRVKGTALFATHYHEIAGFADSLPNVLKMMTDISRNKENGNLIFSHKVVPGVAPSSYGIEVAQLAGIPQIVIEKAKALIHREHLQTTDSIDGKSHEEADRKKSKKSPNHVVQTVSQPSMFSLEEEFSCNLSLIKQRVDQIGERLDTLDVLNTTPVEALNHLNSIVKLWREGRPLTEFLATSVREASPSSSELPLVDLQLERSDIKSARTKTADRHGLPTQDSLLQ